MNDLDRCKETIRKSCESFIGDKKSDNTLKNMKNMVKSALFELGSQSLIQESVINYCDVRHNRKKWYGRVVDWVKWKSPLFSVFYKPKYVERDLVDKLKEMWEYGCFDVSEEEFDKMCGLFAGIKIWEEKYPENPYEMVDVSVNFMPVKPVEYMSCDFVGDEK